MNKLILFILLPLNMLAQQNFIQFKGGEKLIFTKVEIVQEKYEKPYFTTEKKEIFRLEQIESFQNKDGLFIKNDLTASKRDFARRIIKGKVDVFIYDLSSNYIQTGQSNSRDYYAYKMDDAILKQMIYQNLVKDLADNKLSIQKLNKIQSAKKIAPLYYILGGASILTAGILFNTPSSDATTPLFLGGVAMFSIPWILNSQRQKRMDQAIEIYNKN